MDKCKPLVDGGVEFTSAGHQSAAGGRSAPPQQQQQQQQRPQPQRAEQAAAAAGTYTRSLPTHVVLNSVSGLVSSVSCSTNQNAAIKSKNLYCT